MLEYKYRSMTVLSMQVCMYAGIYFCKYAGLQICKIKQIYMYANMQVCKCSTMFLRM